MVRNIVLRGESPISFRRSISERKLRPPGGHGTPLPSFVRAGGMTDSVELFGRSEGRIGNDR